MTAHAHKGVVAIVEDDPAMRKSIDRLLRAHAYATAAYGSAEDFLLSGIADSALALVLDIHLPGLSGIELRLRLLARGSRLPVVFITAYDDEALRVQAQAAGCIAYLQKPFVSDRLIEALERASLC